MPTSSHKEAAITANTIVEQLPGFADMRMAVRTPDGRLTMLGTTDTHTTVEVQEDGESLLVFTVLPN